MSNTTAFLTTIAISEGTESLGDHGYNVIVGGQLFTSYTDHPRVKVWIAKIGQFSTAAGRYQILERYYDAYKKYLKLPDFSPASQDAIATQIIKERGALADIAEGEFELAITKCSNIWASLPGNNYEQHQNTMANLKTTFVNNGGVLSA